MEPARPGAAASDAERSAPEAGEGSDGSDRSDTASTDAEVASRGRRFGALVPALVRLGVTPDMVSWAGLGLSVACAACLAVGASHTLPIFGGDRPSSWWPFVAFLLLGLACLADLLDGDIARAGAGATPEGALLDSTLDRFGDVAFYAGCGVHFAAMGNPSYVALACLAIAAASLVSYVKARGETLAPGVRMGGYWGRGERMVTLLVGCFVGHVPAALWMLATLPFLTVWRRVREGLERLRGAAPPAWALRPGWRRSSPLYLATCAALVVILLALPYLHPAFGGGFDPLGPLLAP